MRRRDGDRLVRLIGEPGRPHPGHGENCPVVGLAPVSCPRCGSHNTETRITVAAQPPPLRTERHLSISEILEVHARESEISNTSTALTWTTTPFISCGADARWRGFVDARVAVWRADRDPARRRLPTTAPPAFSRATCADILPPSRFLAPSSPRGESSSPRRKRSVPPKGAGVASPLFSSAASLLIGD
jgi:hypothetical protein